MPDSKAFILSANATNSKIRQMTCRKFIFVAKGSRNMFATIEVIVD